MQTNALNTPPVSPGQFSAPQGRQASLPTAPRRHDLAQASLYRNPVRTIESDLAEAEELDGALLHEYMLDRSFEKGGW